jgi:Squalene-hopene cyclase C-terminal domain/Family of unknown function (DUF6580)/Prenyltransferase and squalene oxidase repeat
MSWIAASFLVLGLALAAGFGWYERSHPSARVLALVATLAALAALGRIAFAPIPNVKPTTDIVLLTGYALGGAPGFATGAVAAVASNLFFGQGPWTQWQMVGWGLAGLIGAGVASVFGRELGRVALAAACAFAGAVYGVVMNLSLWVTYSGDHSWAKLGAVFATSFPFDMAHVLGNVAFCIAFGPALARALQRFRMRFEVSWAPVAATLGVALLALAVAVPPRADAAVPRRAIDYLRDAQNSDGGLGAAPGAGSTQMHTGWSALGLAAAGVNPRDVTRDGHSLITYIRAHASALRGDLGERTRTILALKASGVDPRHAGGRDLVHELAAGQEADGSFAGRVNTTAFAVLALRAAGKTRSSPSIRDAAAFIASQANADGGFNFAGKGGPSGADDTGAALQALAAAGKRKAGVTQRAADWLVSRQNPDGGFSLQGGASNAQSTAWAVQGLVAAGRAPGKVHKGGSRSPLGYLRSLVTASGAVRYSRTSAQTPVWVTAQALMALARKPLPLAPVPRARTPKATPAPAPAPAATPAPSAAPEKTAAPARTAKPAATPERADELGVAVPEIEHTAPTPVTMAVALVVTRPREAGIAAAVLARMLRPPASPA